jgi:hypothetical protein
MKIMDGDYKISGLFKEVGSYGYQGVPSVSTLSCNETNAFYYLFKKKKAESQESLRYHTFS